jgi:hypothetical protein
MVQTDQQDRSAAKLCVMGWRMLETEQHAWALLPIMYREQYCAAWLLA